MSMKRAIYPGSFDPITNGHMDIISRAKKQFDHIIVAVCQNNNKNPLLTIKQRVDLIQSCFQNDQQVSVKSFDGLLADLAKKENCYTILRGLRVLSDFDYEFQLALTNKSLDQRLDTWFLMTDLNHTFLSSSTVREMLKFKADITSYVPSPVKIWLNKHYG